MQQPAPCEQQPPRLPQHSPSFSVSPPQELAMLKKSAQDPPGDVSSSESSFFCVICQVEKKVVAIRPTINDSNDNNNDNDSNDNNNNSSEDEPSSITSTIITQVDVTNKCPIYQLTNCKHTFCLPCIYAYITSKLMDGQISIPCCHYFHTGSTTSSSSTTGSSNVHNPCNVIIDEVDIYNLLHNIVDEYYYCYNHEDESSSLDTVIPMKLKDVEEEGGIVENDNNELWMKYKRIKFDQQYGKNTVRRCPTCDMAILFDVHVMKQYQEQYLLPSSSSSSNVVVDGSSNDVPTNTSTTKRRTRIFNRVRRWQNNGVTDDSDGDGDGGAASNANEGNNTVVVDQSVIETPSAVARESEYTMETRDDKQEGINMRDDTDDTSSNGIEPILSSLSLSDNNNKEDAYVTQNLGDSAKVEDETNDEKDLSYMTKTMTQNKNDNCEAQISPENSPTAEPPELCRLCDTTMKSDIVSPPPSVVQLLKSTTPCVTCPTCTTNYCYFHSNAHAFGTSACIAYHNNSIESDRINQEYVSQTLHAKSCPTCGISVSKEGGCNQMKCGSCGTHFCWICNAIVDDGAFPEHFRWWNITGCANMQLDETNDPMKLTIIWARVLSIFQIVVLGIPAVVLTLISIIVCPCIAIGCGATNRERVVNFISFWGSFLSSLLLLPFACVGLLIMAAVYCFVAGFSFLLKLTRSRRRSTELSEVDIPTRRRLSNSNRNPNTALRDLSSIIDRMEEGRPSS